MEKCSMGIEVIPAPLITAEGAVGAEESQRSPRALRDPRG